MEEEDSCRKNRRRKNGIEEIGWEKEDAEGNRENKKRKRRSNRK